MSVGRWLRTNCYLLIGVGQMNFGNTCASSTRSTTEHGADPSNPSPERTYKSNC